MSGEIAGGIRRILIIKWSALGDAALATGAIEDVRHAFPDAVLHLDTLPAAAKLFAFDPRFEAVFALPLRDRTHRLRTHFLWLRRVRAARYDLIIDLQSSDHTRLLLAVLSIGQSRVVRRWGLRRGFPYTLAPTGSVGPHAAARMRALLAAAGIQTRTLHPVLYPHADQFAHVSALLQDLGIQPGRYCVFLPGSQAASWLKRWGAERYAELGLLLHRRGIERVVVIGACDEADVCAEIVASINAEAPGVAVYLNALSLLEVIPACAGAAFIVANDTGTAHIAAATNRPMWVLCGPTDPRRVRPLGPNVRAVQADYACLNCYRKTCRWGPRPRCLERISPHAVLALALEGVPAVAGLRVYDDDT